MSTTSKSRRGLSLLLAVFMIIAALPLALGSVRANATTQSVYYMIPVRQGDKYGYLQYQKSMGEYRVQIPLTNSFSDVKAFGPNGLAPVKSTTKGRYGFINRNGNYVIQPQFIRVYPFSGNGLAAVQDQKTEKWGYIDAKGNWVIKPTYDKAYPFNDGLALVLKNWNFYFINKDEKKQFGIPKDYNYDLPSYCYHYFVVRTSKGAGFMDESGKLIVNPDNSQFVKIGPFYSNGRQKVAVAEDRYGAWGYIDGSGHWALQPTKDLDQADRFGLNGLAPATRSGKYGYIDTQYDQRPTADRFRIKPQYKDAKPFCDGGFAPVQKANGKWGVINTRGQFKVPAEYDDIGDITTVIVKY